MLGFDHVMGGQIHQSKIHGGMYKSRLIRPLSSPHLPYVASHGSYVQGLCSSLASYPLLNSPFSSPWKQNTHGWGTSDGWMHLSEAIPRVIQLIWSQVPFRQARLEGNYSWSQYPWPLSLHLLQMDTEAALVKAFGEVDILLTWMQKFYRLWLSVLRVLSSHCLHPCCPQTLGHRLTPWLAQVSL